MYVKKKEDGRNYDFDYLLLTYTSSYEFSLESIKFKNIRNERLRRGKKKISIRIYVDKTYRLVTIDSSTRSVSIDS